MEAAVLCQSCGIALTYEEIKGTETDGLKSQFYCKYCYANGAFTRSTMTLQEMENIVSTQMKKLKFPIEIIQKAIINLPSLNRWK